MIIGIAGKARLSRANEDGGKIGCERPIIAGLRANIFDLVKIIGNMRSRWCSRGARRSASQVVIETNFSSATTTTFSIRLFFTSL